MFSSRILGRKSSVGFALVELLVVVVILAVLAAIAIPVFLHQKRKAEVAATQSSVAAFANLLGNGQSTDGSVAVSQTSMLLTDGAGGTTTLTVPSEKGLRISVGAVEGTSLNDTPVGDTWCVSMTNPEGGVISQRAGETKPNLTGVSCYTAGALNTSFENGGGSVPAAPTSLSATVGDKSASLSWTAPVSDGGTAITNYVVTSAPDGKTCTATVPTTACTVTGLTNETGYVFYVVANNAMGASGNSVPSNIIVPRATTSVPDAPTGVTVNGNSGSVDVSWTAPANDGNLPIVSYLVTSTPGSKTCVDTDNLSCTVTGLTNGISYTFTVKAKNSVGYSASSLASSTVVPSSTPSFPLNVTGALGDRQVAVSWDAPTTDGASAVTGYTVTSTPGGKTCTTTGALTCTVNTLTNGTAYTFTVVAANSRGAGMASYPSAPITPAVAPDSPTNVVSTAGISSIAVSWVASADDGGSTITGYTATAQPGALKCTIKGTSCTITGLTPKTSYSISVVATNAAGNSSGASASGGAVTPYTTPDAPTGLSGTSGNGQVPLTWTAPADNGGSAIIDYTVTSSPGGFTCVASSGTSCTVTGLTNGSAYTFTVKARNAAGQSSVSATSGSVTPNIAPAAPGTPTVTPNQGSITIAWTAPTANGGTALIDYTVTSSPAGLTCTTAALTCTISSGFSNPGTYSFTVRASNAAGLGTASSASVTTSPINNASGGSIATVTNYNGTGQTWKVHTFTGTGTFTVTSGMRPFRVLVVGGGGGGQRSPGGAQGGGGAVQDTTITPYVMSGSYTAVIGGGGYGGTGGATTNGEGGGRGGDSSFSTVTATGGSGTGTGGAYASATASVISGGSVTYSGPGVTMTNPTRYGQGGGIGSGGGGGGGANWGSSGYSGIVIIAYCSAVCGN